MKKIKTILFITATIVYFSCNKNKSNVISVNADIKSSFNYQPGTYWIYRDSLTGNIDSFFVRKNMSEISYLNGSGIENTQIQISQYHILPYRVDTGTCIFIYQDDMFCITYPPTKIFSFPIDEIPLVNYPYEPVLSTCSGCMTSVDSGEMINVYDKYFINGVEYDSVAEVTHHNTIDQSYLGKPPYHYFDRYYICPKVGLIKICLNHPIDSLHSILEIVKYIIIK